MSYTAPLTAPPPAEAMQRFIETEDITCLEKPLLFERNDTQFKKFQCCQAATTTVLTYGMMLPCRPIASCCPTRYTDQFSLKLDKDALTFQSANNDCCCHMAKTLKTVPLEKIQDVELQSNCCLTCFGLQFVNVQTAGQGGTIAPEVSAPFLKSPEKVREAIRLAVKLSKQQGQGNGGYGAQRPPVSACGAVAPAAGKAGGSLVQRLQDMDGLVVRGVLTRAEADGLKVSVLAAPTESWLCRLGEAADLRDRGLITGQEFEQLKASLLAQIRAAA